MTKKLTQTLEEKLFELHKCCFVHNGQIELRSYAVTLYAKEISKLYHEGYDVRIHIAFASYYRGRLYPQEK